MSENQSQYIVDCREQNLFAKIDTRIGFSDMLEVGVTRVEQKLDKLFRQLQARGQQASSEIDQLNETFNEQVNKVVSATDASEDQKIIAFLAATGYEDVDKLHVEIKRTVVDHEKQVVTVQIGIINDRSYREVVLSRSVNLPWNQAMQVLKTRIAEANQTFQAIQGDLRAVRNAIAELPKTKKAIHAELVAQVMKTRGEVDPADLLASINDQVGQLALPEGLNTI